jgi:hypothetical protein
MGPKGEMLNRIQHDMEKGTCFFKTSFHVKKVSKISASFR